MLQGGRAPKRRRRALAGASPASGVGFSFSRGHGWWEAFVQAQGGEREWRQHFRMTQAAFAQLVEALQGRLQQADGVRRLPVEKRVALALFYLASGYPFRDLAERFGVELATVEDAVVEVCSAIEEELLSKVVCLGPNVMEIMSGFSSLGFPHCIGAIDEASFRLPVSENVPESSDWLQDYSSVVVQGTVDHTGRFIDVELALAGRTYGSFLLHTSALCHGMDVGAFVPGNPTLTLDGVAVPPLIVGDWAYPMRRWLMTPYRLCRGPVESYFNHTAGLAQYEARYAFERLKSRWGCLTAPFQVQKGHVDRIVLACIVLHNICEENGRGPPLARRAAPKTVVLKWRDPPVTSHLLEGQEVRDVVARFMLASRRHCLRVMAGG
ncbi:uncharacterized protein LOC132584296 [Heteronotia binoei]|uniref:uncharacterized protein LOC132584296 n=1 Tax=Heteronotia binoei TaxID=13085 RepID=UPI002931CF91|nr:uncharacterized protein LOC132584296 [Heteronotia binoei]